MASVLFKKPNADAGHNYLLISSSNENNLYLVDLNKKSIEDTQVLQKTNVTGGDNQKLAGIGVVCNNLFFI